MDTREQRSRSGNGRAAIIVLAGLAAGAAVAARFATQTATVTVTQATNVAATLSPDRGTLILDVQGAHFSPKGDLVAFQAYKGGTFHIWSMRPDGSGVTQLTDGHGDDREPRVSPDGTKIVFASDRAFANSGDRSATIDGSYDIWQLDLTTKTLKPITTATSTDEFEPTWSPDGTKIAFV